MKLLNSKTFKSFIGVVALTVSMASPASIISTSGDVNNINGLDWLDLSMTNGKTLAQSLDANAGYRAATFSEVSSMYDLFDVLGDAASPFSSDFVKTSARAGYEQYTRAASISGDIITPFMDAFGLTARSDRADATQVFSWGWVFSDVGVIQLFGQSSTDLHVDRNNNPDRALSSVAYHNYGRVDRSDSFWGWYIVKDQTVAHAVTEPSILALMGLGIFGLGLSRRKMKK